MHGIAAITSLALSFQFFDKFHRNDNNSVAIKSGSAVLFGRSPRHNHGSFKAGFILTLTL